MGRWGDGEMGFTLSPYLPITPPLQLASRFEFTTGRTMLTDLVE